MNNTMNLYSTIGCAKCQILEKLLNNKHVTYNKISDVDLMLKKGFMSVPVLEINGTVMKFSEAMQYVNQM